MFSLNVYSLNFNSNMYVVADSNNTSSVTRNVNNTVVLLHICIIYVLIYLFMCLVFICV